MNKLLRANFARLWKSRLFWLETAFMFGFGVFITVGQYFDMVKYNELHYLDVNLFFYVVFIGCCAAVFCSIFTGTDYSDGAIRNKLVVGHHRSSIYLSNWLTSIVSALTMTAAFLLSYCTLGCFLLKPPIAKTNEIAFLLLISIFTIIAYVSLFHMLSMLITKKSSSAVICLVLFFGLFLLATVIKARLDAPEYIEGWGITNGVLTSEMGPNPKYLQPAARKVYQFFLDVLPSGQSLQILVFNVVHPYLLMLYSAVVSAALTLFGIAVFKNKDLK